MTCLGRAHDATLGCREFRGDCVYMVAWQLHGSCLLSTEFVRPRVTSTTIILTMPQPQTHTTSPLPVPLSPSKHLSLWQAGALLAAAAGPERAGRPSVRS
jgi:hypothetical protein